MCTPRMADLGHVADFLIDETTWSVRYLVVDTGNGFLARRCWSPPRDGPG